MAINAVDKLKEMLDMQLMLNDATNGNEWRTGITKDGNSIDWVLCATMETGELIDSVPWKHWKDISANPDMENIHVELVDIYHFLQSKALELETQRGYDSLDLFTVPFGMAERDGVEYTNAGMVKISKDFMLSLLQLDEKTTDAGFMECVTLFINMMEVAGLEFTDLYTKYMVKNILNGFRQRNGYKEGTYRKIWEVNGEMVEDNVAVFTGIEELGGDVSHGEITVMIEDLYRFELERREGVDEEA